MRGKYISPTTRLTAFNCPHCGVLTTQYWYRAFGGSIDTESKTPNIWRAEADEKAFDYMEVEERRILLEWIKKASVGYPFFENTSDYSKNLAYNVHFSMCYECDKIAVWIHDKLAWPNSNEAAEPNPDLPDDVRADYEEAGLVLNTSPRSAAALLRQAVQRLCVHLGEKGKNIDGDIAALVQKGLDKRIQKALDVVRVIGNNAVHPGQIDLKDDRATAEKLFGLVNLIADALISQPKHIDAMFDDLPEGARQAIEKRDAPKQIEDKSAGN
ncbi:DUF4145 domain-containing protein [Mesorhizobium sp. M1312]|uniref:DUF4145 domain-containing protein n=1 Tax=unclassified Mesorhizobium TaxID=325217 RepID=UPI00333A4A39